MHSRLPLAGAAAATLLQLAACQTSKPTTASTTSASSVLGTAPGAAPVASGPAIETLGTYRVPAREFAYVYKKNNGTAPDYGTRASVTDYLTLYTNFRLKVLDAEKQGLDTTQAFRRELDGYRQQLAQPYLTEKGVTDQLVREAYDRMSQEVNASHILIRVAPDAAPADTLAAYQKVVALRQRVTGGEDFGTVARSTSEDPSAAENGGKLGYFTSMQMVYPFESAAYRTPVGQVSQPIRTRFGYHIIKVNDRRAAQGEIKVAHLMVRVTPQAPKADSAAAHKKINELYARLRKGENWNKLVAQFSEDAGSAPNGGELPAFGTGRMIPSFEEVAFKLQKPGDIAAPVQTPYGWHIIKLVEKQPIAAFASMEPTLKSKVAKDSRSELNRAAFLKRVRQEDQFVEIPAAKALAFAQADTALLKGRYKFNPATMTASGGKASKATKKAGGDKLPLFTIMGKPYPVAGFLAFAQQNQRPRPTAQPAFAMQQLYDQYVDQSLTEFEKASLPTKYEDYRMLVQEYRDGILLFQLMDSKVWSKAIEDTAGLKKYFMANQANYQFGQRVQGTVISAASPQLLAKAQRALPAGRYPVAGKAGSALVHFQLGTATPANTGGSTVLDDVARRMAQDTALAVTVAGHIRRGESKALARQRADAAIDYLAKTGKVERRRLVAATTGAATTATGDTRLTFSSNSASTLETNLNQQNPLAVQIQQRIFQKGDNKVMDDYLTQPVGTYKMQRDGRYYAVVVQQNLAAGPKALGDARGQATSDYQNYLEKQWIEQLRQQYPVKVNDAEVSKLVTK
ncbi:peptidylprolyl isomerase [Hymenobacter sp. H14-R3]|uniref:peptidylprolyl isomerase n=1 Tax=Hymenobacter sp. H14-R3 TaxID=3046308 RepID=UPI0024B9F11D|nr:peptidylprolyl isomerase [Hymenobacter sp. H14-R3]MDJ0363678.1 peptidylprolyl isomerase [Hymenobacter sp. H14-R3]